MVGRDIPCRSNVGVAGKEGKKTRVRAQAARLDSRPVAGGQGYRGVTVTVAARIPGPSEVPGRRLYAPTSSGLMHCAKGILS
jgi:hypothetical protein